MKSVFTTGSKLIAGLLLVIASSSLMAKNSTPASYVKPGIDLSAYTKVMVKPLNMDNIEVLKPAWEQDNDEVWSFNPEDRAAIQEWFLDAMQNELETNGGYALVADPAVDVLRIEVELLSITPYVKPGTPHNDGEFKTTTLGPVMSFYQQNFVIPQPANYSSWSRAKEPSVINTETSAAKITLKM